MNPMLNPLSLVPGLLSLQFLVFSWKLVVRVSVQLNHLAVKPKENVLPPSFPVWWEVINGVAMVAVVVFCVVVPLLTNDFPTISRVILAGGWLLIAATPLFVVRK